MNASLIPSGRVRLLVTVVLYGVSLFAFESGLIPVWLIGFCTALLTAWCFGFDLKLIEVVPFLLIPTLYAMNMSYVISLLTGINLVIGVIICTAGLYVLLLMVNILNVATVKNIPLKRPALSSLYLHGLLSYFIYAYSVITAEGWGITTSFFVFWASICLFGLAYLFIVSQKVIATEELLWIVFSFEILVISLFFAVTTVIASLFMVGWLFIILGILQHNSEKLLTKNIIREYAGAGILLSLLYFLR